MKALLVILLLSLSAAADPMPTPMEVAIAEKLGEMLPDNLGVAQVHVPASLANVKPDGLVVEPPSQLRPGRPSVKVTVHKKTVYVPVTLAQMTDVAVVTHAMGAGAVITAADVSIEHRAVEGATAAAAQVVGGTLKKDLEAGAPIGAHDLTLPAPSPRGTRVSVDIVHGELHIKGSGVLENPARVGEPARVRLAFNQTVVAGTLVAPGVVVVGDQP